MLVPLAPTEFQLRHWVVRPDTNELAGPDGVIKLDHKVMQLLVYLAQNAGRDLSKDEILRAVWGEGIFSEEVLTVAVSTLRKALGDDARSPAYLKTIPRFGYHMLASFAAVPLQAERKNWFKIIDERIGWRFLIVCFLILIFLLVVLTRKHIGPFH